MARRLVIGIRIVWGLSLRKVLDLGQYLADSHARAVVCPCLKASSCELVRSAVRRVSTQCSAIKK